MRRASGQDSCSQEPGRLTAPQLRKCRAGSAARHERRFVAGYSRRERGFAYQFHGALDCICVSHHVGFSRLRTGSLKRAPRWPTRARSAESCRARNPGVPVCIVGRREHTGRETVYGLSFTRREPLVWDFEKVTISMQVNAIARWLGRDNNSRKRESYFKFSQRLTFVVTSHNLLTDTVKFTSAVALSLFKPITCLLRAETGDNLALPTALFCHLTSWPQCRASFWSSPNLIHFLCHNFSGT